MPGNVRELQNCIQRVVEKIGLADLGLVARPVHRAPTADGTNPDRDAVESALSDANGLVSRAAEALGISRQSLYRRMARHGIKVERKVGR